MRSRTVFLCVALMIPVMAHAQSSNRLSVNTSVGAVTLAKKGLTDSMAWVVRWNNKVIHTFEANTDPDFLGTEAKDKKQPVVGEFGNEVVVGVDAGPEGTACPGGSPFLVVLKKSGDPQIKDIPNECKEIDGARVQDGKLVITLYDKRTVTYQNGKFQTTKAPKRSR